MMGMDRHDVVSYFLFDGRKEGNKPLSRLMGSSRARWHCSPIASNRVYDTTDSVRPSLENQNLSDPGSRDSPQTSK